MQKLPRPVAMLSQMKKQKPPEQMQWHSGQNAERLAGLLLNIDHFTL